MSYNNISYSIPQADIDAVMKAISTINSKLPFLISLSPDERKGLFKLGPKSANFVKDAAAAVAGFPEILPSAFDIAEYNKDTSLFEALSMMKLQIDSLAEKLDDTYLAVGAEAMSESLQVYAYVQTAAKGIPGLKTVAETMQERFRRPKTSTSDSNANKK